ncbi:MAG: FkbM family methyltransferase [Flavobacteriales bacterium]|jgi:FkbM family methyltransferase
MRQLFYKIIYSAQINPILLRINRALRNALGIGVMLPPSGKITLRPEGIKPFVLYTNQSNYVTHLLFWKGYRNFEYSTIFIDLMKGVDVFFDVGANIGYYALLGASANPKARITAFEPSSGPLHYLKKNTEANRPSLVSVAPMALAARSEKLRFFENKNTKYTYLRHNLAGEGNSGSKTSASAFRETTVDGITLGDYLKAHPTDKLDLIKIDTEGNEHHILGAAIETLEIYRPIVICETLYNSNEAELEQLFKGLNYCMFRHVNSGLQETQSLARKHDDGIRNCFFVPSEKRSLIAAYEVN